MIQQRRAIQKCSALIGYRRHMTNFFNLIGAKLSQNPLKATNEHTKAWKIQLIQTGEGDWKWSAVIGYRRHMTIFCNLIGYSQLESCAKASEGNKRTNKPSEGNKRTHRSFKMLRERAAWTQKKSQIFRLEKYSYKIKYWFATIYYLIKNVSFTKADVMVTIKKRCVLGGDL